jgi:2'-5' RNA ligase
MKLIPSFELNEYLLVLTPHDDLVQQVNRIKKKFAEEYDTKHAVGANANIMLCKFYHYAATEARMKTKLQAVAMRINSFMIELEDFGSLPTHTIYINVKTKNKINELVREIKDSRALLSISKEHKAYYPEEPYIAIARKLVPYQFEKGWLEYSNSHFKGSFVANQMTLLRLDKNSGRYVLVQKMSFMNKHVEVKQGNLFM